MHPLLFKTIFKDKIWGGKKIQTILGKDFSPLQNCGETWEISGVEGNISEVREGEFSGRSLPSLIEEFKGQLVGEKVYRQFGSNFPLLIKFIDANEDLSIQVHPGDRLAQERHNCFGKTEMWYVLQADEGSILNVGFNRELNEEIYLKHLHENSLEQILNFEKVSAGDVYYLPSGRVHYIGKGVFLAEIQQSSDVTYRIYDFDRVDEKGNKRELHTEQALAAIDYQYHENYKTSYSVQKNRPSTLVASPYFTTNLLELDKSIERDYGSLDSFVIYICVKGTIEVKYGIESLTIHVGDCVLIPAIIKNIALSVSESSNLLEVYI